MPTLTIAILHAVADDRRVFHRECEFGVVDVPDYEPPYWIALPVQRVLNALDQPATYTTDFEEWWAGMHEPEEVCPHGLSLWLCADPVNHYPSDRSW